MTAAYEMTADQYIAAIGGRSADADWSVAFDAARACPFFLTTEVSRFGDYVIAATDGGSLHAFVAEEVAEDDSVKSVGYFKAEGQQTTLAVSGDHCGLGLGSELLYHFRKTNPLQKSGGLSAGGEALNRKFHARLVAEAKSAGLI